VLRDADRFVCEEALFDWKSSLTKAPSAKAMLASASTHRPAGAKLGVRADGDTSEAALAERTERLRSVASECETGASDWRA
jgi:hypothetical protein